MVSMKRAIAAMIVCFKPHVFLTLCIIFVIAHSIVLAIHRGASNSWRTGKQPDLTLTMTGIILVIALVWAVFFMFVVRFELQNELENLLTLFQCSKRGLRFLGVVLFHLGLLACVALLVSAVVSRSIHDLQLDPVGALLRSPGRPQHANSALDARPVFAEPPTSFEWRQEAATKRAAPSRFAGAKTAGQAPLSADTKLYLVTVYKIWLTAITYAFLYLIIENVVMYNTDMSLVEFVHCGFLALVARLTGIDLSDYPAGEMLFNPLMRRNRLAA